MSDVVILSSPSLVILSEAKNLLLRARRVDSATKDLLVKQIGKPSVSRPQYPSAGSAFSSWSFACPPTFSTYSE